MSMLPDLLLQHSCDTLGDKEKSLKHWERSDGEKEAKNSGCRWTYDREGRRGKLSGSAKNVEILWAWNFSEFLTAQVARCTGGRLDAEPVEEKGQAGVWPGLYGLDSNQAKAEQLREVSVRGRILGCFRGFHKGKDCPIS
jgi:hypothetical protein